MARHPSPPRVAALAATLWLACACSGSNPGPLEGRWKAEAPMPLSVSFHAGEVVTNGMTTRATYDVRGAEVTVTYLQGPLKGNAERYRIVDRDTIRNQTVTLKRVK